MEKRDAVIVGVLLGILGILMFVSVLFNGFPYWFDGMQKFKWMACSAFLMHCIVAVPAYNGLFTGG